ncbi:MAG: hypothetical protein AAF203_07965, partial [Pseudomonadota bacterium]
MGWIGRFSFFLFFLFNFSFGQSASFPSLGSGIGDVLDTDKAAKIRKSRTASELIDCPEGMIWVDDQFLCVDETAQFEDDFLDGEARCEAKGPSYRVCSVNELRLIQKTFTAQYGVSLVSFFEGIFGRSGPFGKGSIQACAQSNAVDELECQDSDGKKEENEL